MNLILEDEIKDYDIMGCLQSRGDVKYIWPGLFLAKIESIKEKDFHFYPDSVRGEFLRYWWWNLYVVRIKFRLL